MCMSRHWPPPKYSMEGEEGLPHERQFTIVCTILKYRQVGQGKSKKLAKRQAAHKMWQSLQDANTNNRTQGVDDDEVSTQLHYFLCKFLTDWNWLKTKNFFLEIKNSKYELLNIQNNFPVFGNFYLPFLKRKVKWK